MTNYNNTCDVFNNKDYLQIVYAVIVGMLGVTSFYIAVVPSLIITWGTFVGWISGVLLLIVLLYYSFNCELGVASRVLLITGLSLVLAFSYTLLMKYSSFTSIDLKLGVALAFTFMAIPAAIIDMMRG